VIRQILAAALAGSAVLLLGMAVAAEDRRRVLEGLEPARDDARLEGAPRPVSRRWPVAASGIAGVCVGALVAGPPGAVALGVGGALVPLVRERRRTGRRAHALEEQLLDAVTATASAVRSGRSLGQALVLAGVELGEPLGPMLVDAAHQVALGVPMDAVLDRFADGVGGPDVRLVTGVLKLHRRTGGALAASLDEVAGTLRARRDGARELRSLTAQARLSAAILGLLPLGFFLFLSVVARRDVESAYRTTAGASAIGFGLFLQGAAFVWIRRLLRVEDG
jgi:tight adherence protein B